MNTYMVLTGIMFGVTANILIGILLPGISPFFVTIFGILATSSGCLIRYEIDKQIGN